MQDALGAWIVALDVVALAQVLACERLKRDVARGLSNRQAPRPVVECGARLSLEVVIVDEVGVHARETLLVTELAREPLGLAGDGEHVVEASELEQRWTQFQP